MFAKPNEKKIAWERRQREIARRRQRETESCYREHLTGQRRFMLAAGGRSKQSRYARSARKAAVRVIA